MLAASQDTIIRPYLKVYGVKSIIQESKENQMMQWRIWHNDTKQYPEHDNAKILPLELDLNWQ